MSLQMNGSINLIKRITPVESDILSRLEQAGYEAYLVGGCVRDRLMGDEGREVPDNPDNIDITTDATPEQVKDVFKDMKNIDTGIGYGTVTIIASNGDAGIPVEITTYRTEGGYSDKRHPDRVDFTCSLEDDLKRRDFTINAIAWDGSSEDVKDPNGGMKDMKQHLIRTVGDPYERFNEDSLRIMRALRFASVLDFDIEPMTEKAIFDSRYQLETVPAERLFEEFKKLISGRAAGRVVRKYIDVLGVIIPELLPMKGFQQHSKYHKYDVLEHCIKTMEIVKTNDSNVVEMKMAALFHDIGKPETYSVDENGDGRFLGHAEKSGEITERILKRLKAGNELTDRVCTIISHHIMAFKTDEKLLKRWMNRFTPDVLFEILEIKRADNQAKGTPVEWLMDKFDVIEDMMNDILEQEECFSLKDMKIDGNDLIALGVKKGPEVGRILGILLDAVIDGKVPNERPALLDAAESYAKGRS